MLYPSNLAFISTAVFYIKNKNLLTT